MATVILGDCLEKMKELPDNSVDSIVTDPPYGLEFMGKDWDKGVPGVHFWQEMIRVLKPGGHLLAFSGTRTYHRMAVAIEDAGFEIRDMIEWVYGSGFPKSLNIGKKIDQLQGNEREETGEERFRNVKPYDDENGWNNNNTTGGHKYTKGTSEYEGWGTALKPAHEPICMARKPLAEKTVAENCLKWGTGGINVDASRVGIDKNEDIDLNPRKSGNSGFTAQNGIYSGKEDYGLDNHQPMKSAMENGGRFPANLILSDCEEVRACFPETVSKWGKTNNLELKGDINFVGNKRMDADKYIGDSGNASRFFKSIIYQAKASKSERGSGNGHPTVKPIALMEYLITMVTPKGGVVLDPFMGSGTTGLAAKGKGFDFIGIEKDEGYFKIAKTRIDSHIVQTQLF